MSWLEKILPRARSLPASSQHSGRVWTKCTVYEQVLYWQSWSATSKCAPK